MQIRALGSAFGAYIATLAGSGSQELYGTAERRDNVLLITRLGLATILIFALFNTYLAPYRLLGAIEAAVGFGILLPTMWLVRLTLRVRLAENLLMAAGLTVFGSLAVLGGVAGTGLFWTFVFPFLSFFLKGQQAGWHWNLAFIVELGVLLHTTRGTAYAYPYPAEQLPHFLGSLLFMCLVASCFNLLRNRFQEKLHAQVEENTAAAKRYLERLQYLAQHDERSGLPNRGRMLQQLEQDIAGIEQRGGGGVVVLCLHLKRLLEISNIVGPDSAEDLVRQVATSIREDVGLHGTLGRLNLDEMLLIYRLPRRQVEIDSILKRISAHSPVFELHGFPVHMEYVCGLAVYPLHGRDAAQLLRKAEQAMLAALRAGREVSVYSEELDRRFVLHHYRFGGLHEALAQRRLQLYFQPQVELFSGRLLAAEALTRWFDTRDGEIPPQEFIPLAESSGLIKPLTRWALGESLTACAGWQAELPGVGVAVNLSASNLRDPSLLLDVELALSEHRLPAERVQLELTEGALSANPEKSMHVMHQLLGLGVKLAIDDYGAGFTALSHLKHLPANDLKIDQSFVQGLLSSSSDRAIVQATIELAHRLGYRVLAEGVETQEAADYLQRQGCDAAQGFYFCPPLPLPEFLAWARRYQEQAWHADHPPERHPHRAPSWPGTL